jgi:hypothetical protein
MSLGSISPGEPVLTSLGRGTVAELKLRSLVIVEVPPAIHDDSSFPGISELPGGLQWKHSINNQVAD